MPIASVLHILQTIKDRGPISRTDLQHVTGLSWGTITNTTRDLLNRKFIHEQGALATKAGRKPVQLALNPASHCMVGVEITPAQIEAVLINLAGETLWHASAKLPPGQMPESVLDQVAELARRGMGTRVPMGVGVVLPDSIKPASGVIRAGEGLAGWNDPPVRQMLEARLHLPVHLEQHANALALAQRWFGQTETAGDDFICIYLGDSIEAGIVSGGEIFRGHAGMAGQLAHLSLDPNGPACRCGGRGCVDVFCATPALLAPETGAHTNGTPHTLAELIAAAGAANAHARAAFERMGAHLGVAIRTLRHLFDPAFIVLTGPTTAAAPCFMPALEQAAGPGTKIVLSRLADHAPALGVCALILQHAFMPQSAPAGAPQAMPA